MSDGLNVAVSERDATRAAALIDPVRVAMLERLAEPGSASSLARELGLPRQRVNYHLRELEKARFVEFVEERRRGNCVERLVRATARSYLLSPEILGKLGDAPTSSTTASAPLSHRRRVPPDPRGVQRRRAGRRGEEADVDVHLADRDPLRVRGRPRVVRRRPRESAVARLTAKYHDANASDGRTFKLLTAVYPAARTKAEKGRSS